MKSTALIGLAVLAMGLLSIDTPSAVTFSFDPDDLIQLYPSAAGDENVLGENKASQVNARRLHKSWASSWHETFYNPTSPQTQPDNYNTYLNWRDGLGANEGISSFNIWLLDNPNARSWGEKLVWDPLGAAPTGTADALGKWQVEVIANEWGPGWLVQWTASDPAYYLNSLSDIGSFSFSGTAYWDLNQNGFDASDPEVQFGESARIWFGAYQSVHFDDQGWGTRSPAAAGPFAALANSGYEGVLDLAAVPEPNTMILLGGALVGAALVVRRRRK